jgi:hypothetical protein
MTKQTVWILTSTFVAATAACALGAAAAAAADVIVNQVALDAATQQAIERAYSTPIKPGRYWYDPVSGVWGLEGGPGAGQIQPGLRLGGPLRADASRGNTGIFVNNRELHRLDLMALQRCTMPIPGRYWVLANGMGGYEGMPPSFNLAQLCGGGSSGGGGGQCQSHSGGSFACSNSRTGIGVIGTGGGGGGVFIDGKVISTPN